MAASRAGSEGLALGHVGTEGLKQCRVEGLLERGKGKVFSEGKKFRSLTERERVFYF